MSLLNKIFGPKEKEINSNQKEQIEKLIEQDKLIIRLAQASTTEEILKTFGSSIATEKKQTITRWFNRQHNTVITLNDKGYGYINLFDEHDIEFATVMFTNDNHFEITISCHQKHLETNLKWFEEKYIPSLIERVKIYNGV